MQLEELLGKEFAIAMGDGVLYRMIVNEELTIHARNFTNDFFFYLYASLGPLPSSDKLKTFLEESLFNQGIYFSYYRTSNKLILMTSLDSRIVTRQEYESCFQKFVDTYFYWKEKFDSESPQEYEKEDLLKLMSQKKRIFFI